MGAGGVPVCQWAAKGIGDQKPCWSLEIAALSPSARDHLGLKPKQELPPGSSQPLWHRSAEAGGSGAEPRRCGRSHDCPPSVWQSPSQALVAGDFSFKQSPLSLSPFPPDLPPSQGVCPRGTASSALRHAGSRVPTGCPQGARRVPAAPLRPAGSSRLVRDSTWAGIIGYSGRNSDPLLSPNLAHFTLHKTQARQMLFVSSFWVSFWLL